MQLDGYSLEAQKEVIEKEAAHRGMKIIGEYSDEGKSGKNIKGRPEFQKMLNDIARLKGDERPDYVIVFKLSRFGRNAADTLNSLQYMEDYGVHLLCVKDSIDSAGATGKLMISVLAAVAEIERENIKEQTMAGREQKARDGKWNGGFAPYGYKLEYTAEGKGKGELMIDEGEAEIIKLIYDKFLHTDKGVAGVAKWLNDNGYRKKLRQNGTVDRFSASFVKGIIDNPVYMGKIAYGRRRTEKIDGTRNEFHIVKQAKDSYEIYDGNHEAITTEEMWYKAQAKRDINAFKREKVYSLEHEHVLSALVKCPVCGASMYGVVNRKKKKGSEEFYTDMFYYLCKNRRYVSGHLCDYKKHIRQDVLDAEVEALFLHMLDDVGFENEFNKKQQYSADVAELHEKIKRLEESKSKEETKKKRMLNKIMALDIDDEIVYETMYNELSQCLQEIIHNIAVIDSEIMKAKMSIESVEANQLMFLSVDDFKNTILTVIHDLSSAEKKEFYNGIIERIEIYPERLKNGRQVKSIKFKIPAMFSCTDEANEFERTYGEDAYIMSEEMIDKYFLPKEKQDETVCLLSKLHEAKHHVNVTLDMDELDITSAESKATYEEIKAYVLENHGLQVTNLYIAQVKRKCGIIERENYNKSQREEAKPPQCPEDKEKAIRDALKHFGMV